MTMRSILKSWVERYFFRRRGVDSAARFWWAVFAAIIWFGAYARAFFFFTALVLAFSAARRGQRPDEAASAALAGRHFGVCGVR